jgi:hypothetical protein
MPCLLRRSARCERDLALLEGCLRIGEPGLGRRKRGLDAGEFGIEPLNIEFGQNVALASRELFFTFTLRMTPDLSLDTSTCGRRLDVAGGLHLDDQRLARGRHRLIGDGSGLPLSDCRYHHTPPANSHGQHGKPDRPPTHVLRRLLASSPSTASISVWRRQGLNVHLGFRILSLTSIDAMVALFRRAGFANGMAC